MGEMTIEYTDGQWWVCVHGNRVAHLGNLSPDAGDYEVRRVAEATLAKMTEAATVVRATVVRDPMLAPAPGLVASFLSERSEQEVAADEWDAIREAADRSARLSRLTDEHMEALRQWAKHQGATWRLKLRRAWECGTLTNYTSAADAELLQQVRNIIGPSGLAAVKL